MREHTRLVSDGDQFFEVPSRPSSPSYFDASPDVEMDLASTSLVATAPARVHPLWDLATPTSTAPAVAPAASSAPSAPSPRITVIGGPQSAVSQRAARVLIEAYILASAWFESHAMEPCVDAAGVPDCALQLAKPGDSIWACFFRRVRKNGVTILKCVGCSHGTTRLNRAVGHQRAKWEHKPFACTDPGW
jgi:hypothetical protein